jgi:hypothetical protein
MPLSSNAGGARITGGVSPLCSGVMLEQWVAQRTSISMRMSLTMRYLTFLMLFWGTRRAHHSSAAAWNCTCRARLAACLGRLRQRDAGAVCTQLHLAAIESKVVHILLQHTLAARVRGEAKVQP